MTIRQERSSRLTNQVEKRRVVKTVPFRDTDNSRATLGYQPAMTHECDRQKTVTRWTRILAPINLPECHFSDLTVARLGTSANGPRQHQCAFAPQRRGRRGTSVSGGRDRGRYRRSLDSASGQDYGTAAQITKKKRNGPAYAPLLASNRHESCSNPFSDVYMRCFVARLATNRRKNGIASAIVPKTFAPSMIKKRGGESCLILSLFWGVYRASREKRKADKSLL